MKYLYSLLLFVTIILFNSCSDDPVTVVEDEFDPPRFNWRSMEISGSYYSGMWALDTNNIYFSNYFPGTLLHISNGNINTYNVGNYAIYGIDGISNNEIYIFGAVTYPDNTLTIIKWNGAGFQYFPTGIIVGTNNAQIKGCVVSSNEVWIGSERGLCRFDGVNTNTYSYENPDLYLKDLFFSDNNKVQYISEKLTETSIQTCLYEFRDTGFVKIFDYIRNPNKTMSYTFLREIGGYKYGLQLNSPINKPGYVCIDNFIDSMYTANFCFNDKITITTPAQSNNPVGINLQDLVSVVEVSNTEIFVPGYRSGIIHWNGNKPSAEIGLNVSGSDYNRILISIINSDTYLVLEPPNPNNRILHIGTKK